MQRDGLLTLAGDRHLELSTEGRQIATRVMRKHRLAERLLLDVIGLEWEYVHEEACRWEHVMSERVERKILALIGDHRESPYGNPIPGLDELGEEAERGLPGRGDQTCSSWPATSRPWSWCAASASRSRSTTRRSACSPPPGCCPAQRVRVRRQDGRVIAVRDGADEAAGVSLPDDVAAHVFAAVV